MSKNKGANNHSHTIQPVQKIAALLRDGSVCRYCYHPVTIGNVTMEHLSSIGGVGYTAGISGATQLLTVCRECNARKGSTVINGVRNPHYTIYLRQEYGSRIAEERIAYINGVVSGIVKTDTAYAKYLFHETTLPLPLGYLRKYLIATGKLVKDSLYTIGHNTPLLTTYVMINGVKLTGYADTEI